MDATQSTSAAGAGSSAGPRPSRAAGRRQDSAATRRLEGPAPSDLPQNARPYIQILTKKTLQLGQTVRILHGIVTHTWLGSNVQDSGILSMITSSLKLYSERTRGRPGHGLGPRRSMCSDL